MKNRLSCIFVGFLCILIVGCYQKEPENDGVVISFQAWGPLLLVLAGLASVPLGILLFARSQRFRALAVIMCIAGPVAAGVIAPGMFLDRVVVNQDGFSARYGLWWNPSVHQIRYEELNLVRLDVVEKTSRGRKTYSYYFDCSYKSGKQERIPLGDLMRQAAPELVQQFHKHGVPVMTPPNLPIWFTGSD
jgi:hypothetical protein